MIRTSIESARGCGYRKEGGFYLVAPELTEPCGRLPLPLDRCQHCGQGIGPSRSWTWVIPATLFPAQAHGGDMHNAFCPLGFNRIIDAGSHDELWHRTAEYEPWKAGLIWVGEAFYPTPESFTDEAAAMGISRRIQAPPRGFVVGEHWVYLGHRKAIAGEEAGIMTLFKPTAVEYVVTGEESDEEIEALEERGISPVKVIRDIDVAPERVVGLH